MQRQNGEFIESLLDRQIQRAELSREDRGLLQELVYGVVRREMTLDWLIAQKSGGKPQKPLVQTLLRLGLYQMFWLDRVPGYAAVNETVEICKKSGLPQQARFINAVLRGYSREIDATKTKLQLFQRTQPALAYSHPAWLCERWERRWGRRKSNQLLEWNNSPPPTYARVNTLKSSPDQLRASWEKEGVHFAETAFDWVAPGLIFKLEGHPPLAQLQTFQQGWFYIQDPSTVLAVTLLDPAPGEKILDVCAAPGGKTTLIAQRMQNQGKVLAEDLDDARLKLVRENAQRLGANCISVDRSGFLETMFDRVLVDAPCSNTGVMRRRVELRWRIQPEEITRLAATQVTILNAAARRVRANGVLIYSTCSLEEEENQGVVREFLSENPQIRLEVQRELLPFIEGVDGAYCARFRM